MKNLIKLILFFSIIFIILVGPSGDRHQVPLDGSSLCEEKLITPTTPPKKEPVVFTKTEIEYKGTTQVLHILELDLSNSDLDVFPILSNDGIFGFEHLSDINKRYKAQATINAGFNFAYGQPSGLVIQNGRILTTSKGYGRILLIQGQKAWFKKPPFSVWIEAEDYEFPVDSVNPYPKESGILVFTPEFGATNRINEKCTTCIVRNNIVISSDIASGETEIPKDGFLIVDLRTEGSPLIDLMPGQSVNISLEEQADQGYQCSGSLVEDGINVAKDMDAWAGNLRIPTPRTAVGIKDENTLIFLVIDGRQIGYSTGVTGSQLADILISLGVTEAAILDGGASSEMIYKNEIVNRPSTGKERLLASAFVIKVDDNNSSNLQHK